MRKARGGGPQLVGGLALAGKVGVEQSFHGRGGSEVSMMNTTTPATFYSGEGCWRFAMVQRDCWCEELN